MLKAIGAKETGWRVGRELRKRVLAVDPIVAQVPRAAWAQDHRAVFERALDTACWSIANPVPYQPTPRSWGEQARRVQRP